MMNTVVGSAIGGVVAGAIALGAAAVMRPSPAPAFGVDQPASAYTMPVANTAALNNGATFANGTPTLQCQPHEEAVLQRALVGGREVSAMTCITRANAAPMYYGQPAAYGQPVYGQPVYRDEMVTRPVVRTVNTAPARRVSQSRETVRREQGRSWAKTAMIIGGGAGGGAGIGGLIGGKKGALIGAAIGGGAATIYESTKR
ncbi:MAG TPA: hypothetical protein VFV51_05050 [Vicinamibacterales bacterium]|nr:hypothetical protein [Vicinamibacterales bacterium]